MNLLIPEILYFLRHFERKLMMEGNLIFKGILVQQRSMFLLLSYTVLGFSLPSKSLFSFETNLIYLNIVYGYRDTAPPIKREDIFVRSRSSLNAR